MAATGQEKLGKKTIGRYADPRLLHVGQAKSQDPSRLPQLEAYRLLPDSPCLKAGILIQGNGGRDFWGTPLPLETPPSIGACQQAHDQSDHVQRVSEGTIDKSSLKER